MNLNAYGNSPASEYQRAREENRKNVACVVFLTILLVALVVGLTGCGTTVKPDLVAPGEVSYDGSVANSGIILSTETGFVVTDHFRARYNALIAVYGNDFTPPLKVDTGIAMIGTDRHLITKQAMIWFLEMNAWRRAGLKPKASP
jgi:hypothetical protein